jgi:hypothetical protein
MVAEPVGREGLEEVVDNMPTKKCGGPEKLFGYECWCSTNNTQCEHYNPNAAATFKEVSYGGCLKNYRLKYGPRSPSSDEKVN